MQESFARVRMGESLVASPAHSAVRHCLRPKAPLPHPFAVFDQLTQASAKSRICTLVASKLKSYMALLKSSRMVSGTAGQQQQLVARTGPRAAKHGSSVVRRFRKGDGERMRELATLPEQPFTQKYPPPGDDLADIIPNPGVTPLDCRACNRETTATAA
jgi:hypothetical protein